MPDEKEFVKNEEGEEIVNPDLVKSKEVETEDNKDADLEKSESEVETADEEIKKEESEEVLEKKEEVIEPKPVEGETIRERALRKEIEKLRADKREGREKEIFGDKKEKEVKKSSKVDLSQYNKEEVEKFKGILETLADDLGFIKKEDVKSYSYEDKANAQLNEFLDNHPEYSPENDKDNTLWGQFKEEFALYKKPEDPKLFKKLFNKIHNELTGGKEINKEKILAKQEKIRVASHGGASKQKSSAEKEAKIDPTVKAHLKGFSDEEMEDYFGI